jgi:hypothetical protein
LAQKKFLEKNSKKLKVGVEGKGKEEDWEKRRRRMSEEDTSFYLEDSHLIFPFILLTSNSKVK